MNSWLLFILCIIAAGYILDCTVSFLNLRALSPDLPEEFRNVYNTTDYAKSQEYTKTTTKFALLTTSVSTIITVIFLLFGGFNIVDTFARSFGFDSIVTGLLFSGFLGILSFLLQLPFTIYSTFVIEERFGFNRTTAWTFIVDTLKSFLLILVFGAPLLALVLWFFEATGPAAWLFCWGAVVFFSIFIQFLAPVLILPLFNKFSPLDDGQLKDNILRYAEREEFQIKGIFTMDGSKRSTKLNAFFTGFGKFRKIVFYDTLIEKLSVDEIVAVLAHEMGHFKLKHIPKMICCSVLQTGVLFFLLSLVLENKSLFTAFQMDHISIYASLVFFGFLYTPVNLLVSIAFNFISRKHEFEADKYAAETSGKRDELIGGLKKLCQANMANLTPHPAAVFLEYSHPPILERIQALRQLQVDK